MENTMASKPVLVKFLYFARDLRSRAMFTVLKNYCKGNVLDVGGGAFFLTAQKKSYSFKSWTTIEYYKEEKIETDDNRFRFVQSDGCRLPLKSGQFDTILNIQVLEHVFDSAEMVYEIARVLKPDGYCIFLIPQTSTLHWAPNHYYNFTRYWIKEVMKRANLEIIELKPLGGIWTSMASHLVYFFLQSFRFKGMSSRECKRSAFFYLLYPVMALYAIINIPICMLLSLGDLSEEPNNHLVIVKKTGNGS